MHRQIHNTVFALTVSVLVLLPAAHAQLQWDGDCPNDFWHSMCGNPLPSVTNWTPNQIPGNGDDVTIGGTVVHIFGQVANCGTITAAGGLNITNGGQLYCHGIGGSVENLMMSNASVGCAAGGILEILGNSTTNGGVVYGPGETWNVGSLSGLSLVVENNPAATFQNQFNSQMTLSSIQIDPGATLKNNGGAITLVPHQQVNGGGINASSGGTGLFINEGEFITQHDGTAWSHFTIAPTFQQNSGEFRVQGPSATLGTVINNNSTFSGGQILVGNEANLRFWSGIHDFTEPMAIYAAGNVHLQLPFTGPSEWRVSAELDVSMTGDTNMFVMESGRMVLHDTLNFIGKALWKGMTIQRSECTECEGKFRNISDVTIDTGAPSNAVKLDATFHNDGGNVRHRRGNLIFDDDAHFLNSGEFVASHYYLYDGDITRIAPGTPSEFVNGGLVYKQDSPDTGDSLVTVEFRNTDGSVWVDKSTLTFGQGCLRLEGGTFSVFPNGEVVLSGDTHFATVGTTNFTGTGECRVLGGTLRVDFLAEVQNEMGSLNVPPPNGFILDTNGRLGGTGMFRNMAQSILVWKQGTIGVTNGAGGFNANVINEGITLITGGTATVRGAGSTFTNKHAGTVVQDGHLYLDGGTVINRGQWLADDGNPNFSGPGAFINDPGGESAPPDEDGGHDGAEGTTTNGLFRCDVQPNQTVTVSCPFDNRGAVSVESGNLIFGGPIAQLQNTVLSDGAWIVQPGASLNLPGTLTAIAAGASIHSEGTFTDLRTLQTNQGTLQVAGQTICGSDNNCNNHNHRFTNEGVLVLSAPAGATPSLTVDGVVDNGLLALVDARPVVAAAPPEGTPFIALDCDALNNDGTVAPGSADTPGSFSMIGNFNQSSTGVLDIELGGEAAGDEHDQLIVAGNAVLDGHLHRRVLPGYLPKGGEQFTIITASNGTISGAFESIDGPGQYSLTYSPTSVTLTLINPPHAGDINGDGVTNVSDLLGIILAWGACPPAPTFCPADLTGDGFVDADDLLVVIVNWG